MTHRERCEQECTRDVIFLLQIRRVNHVAEPEGYEYDGEGFRPEDDPDAPYLTDDELLDMDCAIAWWHTESVWLDREEAECWGEAHAYRFGRGRKGTDWRVYGVPAEGELAEMLRGRDEQVAAAPAGGR